MNLKRWILLSVGLVGLTLWVLLGTFRGNYVCAHCGATKSSLDLQIPFTDFTVCTLGSTYSYTFGETLVARGLVDPHPHNWLFCTGLGNGIGCALGRGRYIESRCRPETLKFLDDTILFQSKTVAQKWLVLIFEPQNSNVDRVWEYPLEGMPNLKAYTDWQTETFDGAKDPRLLALLPPTSKD